MARALVVVNQSPSRGKVAAQVVASLRRSGWHGELATTPAPGNAGDVVRDRLAAHHDLVVAVGGDGTVRQVAAVLAGGPMPLAIVAAGTGNLLAGNLGLPAGVDAAVRTAISGRPRRIDLGRIEIGGTAASFLVAAGVGFDAIVMRETGDLRKRGLGKFAYLATMVPLSRAIRNVPVDLTIDALTLHTTAAQIFIANVGQMAGWLQPRRPISPDDGLFDVVLIRASGSLGAARAAWDALRFTGLGQHPAGRVFWAQGRQIRVEAVPPLLVEVDGDLVGATPLTATLLPRAVAIVVPRED